MPFKLHTSNRLELLTEQLAELLKTPITSALRQEIIVVQSRGMERWISLQLAEQLGICANVQFPFPNSFLSELLKRVFPDLPDQSVYDPQLLTWRIMRLLGKFIDNEAFAPLRNYLDISGGDIKSLQLSERVADLFDQYLLFRPKMILDWEEGRGEHWQAQLWRAVVAECGNSHKATTGQKLIKTIHASEFKVATLPERISVFGISALPEFYLRVFEAISSKAEVHLFLMNPCREYWGEVRSPSEISRIAKKQRSPNATLDLFPFAADNRLLASFGKLGRDFFNLIEEFDCEQFHRFQEPTKNLLLGQIQNHLLNLQDSAALPASSLVAETDISIQVHSCHSARREVEALQDNLLNMFEQDSDLAPNDILVMAPDIAVYAPFIQAVFDLPYEDPKRLPYSIADRSYDTEGQVVEAFLAILDLPGTRFGAAQILAILETGPIQDKFHLQDEDIALVQHWLQKTRIRWGKDAEHRQQLGLPRTEENTWQTGLDRLLLGFALPANGKEIFQDMLPFDDVEGGQAVVLGNLVDFIDRLFNMGADLEKPHTLKEWQVILTRLLDTLFESDTPADSEIHVIMHAINTFGDFQSKARFESEVDRKLILYHLRNKLRKEGYGYGFLTGGITFCSMLPMRSIPAKVICLLGMNNDAYPRYTKRLGFDLMAQQPRLGDRSRRNDDRYLFLECLLSARERLHISYIGQSIRDNSVIPPSVIVSELLAYIEDNFVGENKSVSQQLTVQHPLQPFSPEYFKGREALFSYSEQNLQAARRMAGKRGRPQAFMSGSLPEPGEEFKTVSLMDLYRFFRNPARYLLNRRMGLYLNESTGVLEEKESFTLEGLERYDVGQRLVEDHLSEQPDMALQSAIRSSGELPHGRVGELEFESLKAKTGNFVEKTSLLAQGRALAPLDINVEVDGITLTGKIDNIGTDGLLMFRYARVKAKDHLSVWLRHLVMNLLKDDGYPNKSFLAGVDAPKQGNWEGWAFHPVNNSAEILSQLLALYWQGLTQPLRFFPDSANSFALADRSSRKNQKPPLAIAASVWFGSEREGGDGIRGEQKDPYFEKCFGRDEEPLNEEFCRIARAVFDPILTHQEELP